MEQVSDGMTRRANYLSFLLRLWQESDEAVVGGEASIWRASLTALR